MKLLEILARIKGIAVEDVKVHNLTKYNLNWKSTPIEIDKVRVAKYKRTNVYELRIPRAGQFRASYYYYFEAKHGGKIERQCNLTEEILNLQYTEIDFA